MRSEYKGSGFIPYGIRFNKMPEALNLLSTEIQNNENFFIDLSQGKMPKDFDNKIETGQLPKLGSDSFWGSSKSTILSAGAITVNMLMNNKSSLHETVNWQESSIVHSFSLPQDFNCEAVKSSYLHKSNGTMNFSVVHSGYSFGGSRGLTKKFAPQDCGTIIENSCLTPKLAPECTTTTADLLCIYYVHTASTHRAIPELWNGHENLGPLFSVSNNKEDVIGSVYFWRTFNEKNPEATSLGASGHTVIILGINEQKEFVTIGVSRDMPKVEGYGLQNFPINNTQENTKSFVLDPTELVTSQEEFSIFADIHYDGLNDLPPVVQYFDKELSGAVEEEMN